MKPNTGLRSKPSMIRAVIPVQHTGLRGYVASRLFLWGWSLVAAIVMPLLMVVVPLVMNRLGEAPANVLS